MPLTAGRRLVDFDGTLDELRARAGQIGDAFVRAVISGDQPVLQLAAAARYAAPQATFVSVEPRREAAQAAILDRSAADGDEPELPELFRSYLAEAELPGGVAGHVLATFGDLLDDAGSEEPGHLGEENLLEAALSEVTGPGSRPDAPAGRGRRDDREGGAVMRPLQLSFSGIRSYPAAFGPLDFTGKNLIAILGDTGAGKSTILEAITLALYGNCTWDNQQSKALMAEGAAQMTVDFTFAHDGHRWQVRRVFHANTTPSTHHLKNLDTGEETDNARAVNRRIEALLKLRFDSFRTAVLLPQGQFSRLLTATGTERTALLKDIFGIQVIETLHQHASLHRDRLTSLVHSGQLARKGLLDDPAATAAAAGQAAGQQERFAAHLDKALGSLRATQERASAALGRHARLTAAAADLAQHEVSDAAATTGRIAAIAADLTAQDAQADSSREDWATRQSQAEAELDQAAGDGLTPETLASAATVLDGLPARLDDLAAEHAQLDQDERDAGQEALDLETAASGLRDLGTRADSLEAARQAAATTLREFRDARGRLQDTAGTALLEAARVGEAHHHEHQAAEQLRLCREALPALEADAARTEAARLEADKQLNAVRGREAAHTAGAALSPGDPCLICQRQLPGDYHPPAPADPQALADAEQAQSAASRKERAAAKKLTQAQADTEHAGRSHRERQEATLLARDRLDQARQDAAAAIRSLTQRSWADAGPLSEKAFLAGLEAACTRLSEAGAGHDDLRASSADQILPPARDLGQALEEAAAAAAESATEARKDASAASTALERRQSCPPAGSGQDHGRPQPPRPGAREARPRRGIPSRARPAAPASRPARRRLRPPDGSPRSGQRPPAAPRRPQPGPRRRSREDHGNRRGAAPARSAAQPRGHQPASGADG